MPLLVGKQLSLKARLVKATARWRCGKSPPSKFSLYHIRTLRYDSKVRNSLAGNIKENSLCQHGLESTQGAR